MLVSVDRLNKSLGENRIFSGLSFDIRPGEVLGLCGANGCGKTTLLRMIAGLVEDGNDVGKGGILRTSRVSIGYVPQDCDLAVLPWYSALRNVQLAGKGAVTRAMATKVLGNLDFSSRDRREYPSRLSGGFVQRIAWACALSIQPSLLVLDEPFSNQDVKWTIELIKRTRELTAGGLRSAVLVSHNFEVIVMACDRVLMLKADGQGVTQLVGQKEIRLSDRFSTSQRTGEFREYVGQLADAVYGARRQD